MAYGIDLLSQKMTKYISRRKVLGAALIIGTVPLNGRAELVAAKKFNFQATINAVETVPAEPGCELGGVCSPSFGGDGHATRLGPISFSATLNTIFGEPVPPPAEFDFCFASAGEAVMGAKKEKKKGTVRLQLTGSVCGSMGSDDFSLIGQYKITRGTGKYNGAKGNGQLRGSWTL